MTTKEQIPRIETGVRNFDAIFEGGMPKNAVTVVSGAPGSGKTIFCQQICFHAASTQSRVLYCNTLSEPIAKTLRYLKQFTFFDAKKLEEDFSFVDLGVILRSKGLEQTLSLIMDQIRKVKPAVIVIDSFKTFDDLAKSKEELRKFSYEIAVNLMAWETTGLLLGEYATEEFVANPLFSVVDGHIILSQRESAGEQQRFLQVVKMRGTQHSRDEHSFVITSNGVEVFSPRTTIHRKPRAEKPGPRCKTGIEKLDDIIGDGIPTGSSLLVTGVAGTGKSVLGVEFIYRGALAGEKGIIFSFEETKERLLAAAHGLGWDLQREIDRGMVEMVFIPQPEILVEGHLLMMRERVEALSAQRVVVDSISVFLHKIKDPQIVREKTFQLASIVQNVGAVGFFTADIPYGSNQISRFGVEETVVDGVILLSAVEEGSERQRYIEVYKLRNTAHLKGRHNLVIGKGGVQIFPRYSEENAETGPRRNLETSRLPTGIPGLDALLGGGVFKRSATIIAGSTGIGKTTFGLQFILEGATRGEPGLIFTLEEGSLQLLATADALKLPLRKWVEKGIVELVYFAHEHARAAQLLSVLGDKIRSHKARRVFLDSATYIAREGLATEQFWQTLYRLVARFKALDVTSVLAVESPSLYFGDVSERGLSPLADNLMMLRYVPTEGGDLLPALRVVKTRGSAHDRGMYATLIGEKGMRIGDRLAGSTPTSPTKSSPVRKSSRKKANRR
jgi:circadian clock protein KaiC